MKQFSRFLSFLGPTWGYSPARRLMQSAALIGFMFLLFWPKLTGAESAEIAFSLDALVGISVSLAGRVLAEALIWAGAILAVTLFWPRVFCSHLCPMGTLIDISDWLIGKRSPRRLGEGWWSSLRYYVLAGVVVSAVCGVMLAGYVAPLPILVRGVNSIADPIRSAIADGWQGMTFPRPAGYAAIAVLLALPAMGLLGRRFWCRCLCPTGAVFSLMHLLHIRRRVVDETCIACGRCVNVCSFGAIKHDFSTRPDRCTVCGSCEGACPKDAIDISLRGTVRPEDRETVAPEDHGTVGASPDHVRCTRRGLIVGAAGGLALATGIGKVFGGQRNTAAIVRPPGSLPEGQFLRQCTRCGLCMQVCPSRTLGPMGLEAGLDPLWTPYADGDRGGCLTDCNQCGEVCPVGAIRVLELNEKNAARMGLAVINQKTCLAYAGKNCRLCVDACDATGRNAIEVNRFGGEMDEQGNMADDDDSGYMAPVMVKDKCVGCGLCQAACRATNVKKDHSLEASAIIVEAGPDNQDRIRAGSYIELRKARAKRNQPTQPASQSGDYLPDFLK